MNLRKASLAGLALLMGAGVSMAAPLAIEPLDEQQDVKVVLDLNENHFAVTGGCNTMMGRVHITENGGFRVKQGNHAAGLASTMMACPGDLQKLDERVAAFVQSTPKLLRQGDNLYLVGTVGEEKNSVYIPVELDKGKYLDIEAKPYELVFYYVSDKTVPCEDSEGSCLQVKTEKDGEWEIYPTAIEGFSPVEDYEYRLRLKEYKNDDGSVKHVLDMVVEQGKVQVPSADTGK